MPTDIETLITSYQPIATSTLGHLTDEGYLPGITAQTPAKRLLGRARTLKLPPKDGTPVRQALIQSQPGDVLVIDMGTDTGRACWGEIRTLAAKRKGLAGVVTNGCATDIQALNELDFPVFATGISAITTQGLDGDGLHDQAVTLAGTTIHPGDLLLGDEDGLFVLSARAAEQLLQSALDRQATEADIRRELAGPVTADLD